MVAPAGLRTSQIVRQLTTVGNQATELLSLSAMPGLYITRWEHCSPWIVVTISPGLAGPAEALLFIIPGNPGAAGYYKPFMTCLDERLEGRADVCTISHLGIGVPIHTQAGLQDL